MSDAYLAFLQGVNHNTAVNLVSTCAAWRAQGVSRVHLGIASGGGSLNAGFTAYAQLRGLSGLTFTTYNLGHCNSVALLWFVLGERRLATPVSSFLFHPTNWTFAEGATVSFAVLADAYNTLRQQEKLLYDEVSKASGVKRSTIATWYKSSNNLPASAAVSAKFCHAIAEFDVPAGAIFYQIN
ncbi:MAG: ATP-dependent Clp protease proteolytic subunit [Rhodospirillaceae bacterium]